MNQSIHVATRNTPWNLWFGMTGFTSNTATSLEVVLLSLASRQGRWRGRETLGKSRAPARLNNRGERDAPDVGYLGCSSSLNLILNLTHRGMGFCCSLP